ncbi:MAG: ubiquinol-cytochrome c reductase iron-sulfur subunit [Rhodospirillaceae bacterium]
MSTIAHPSGAETALGGGGGDASRRNFLYLATSAVGAAGLGAFAWPLIDSMNPAADALALASIEVDIASVKPGEQIVATWQGKPVFIRRRTPEEIKAAESVSLADLKDPQPDSARVQKAEWLILVGICTHLGCVPNFDGKGGGHLGEYGGWFCPCHGSQYDTSGRIRKGPAPQNLAVPKYVFLKDTVIKIG